MRKHAGRSDARSNERGQASSKAANSRNGQSHSMSSRSNDKAKLSRNPISQLWLNDFLSEMLAVEEGGEKLYAKALEELQHDELRDKLEEFHEETQRHIELVREMMQTAGIDENHKSPTAAAAEQKRLQVYHRFRALFERFDILLTPAIRILLPDLGCIGAAGILTALVEMFRARQFWKGLPLFTLHDLMVADPEWQASGGLISEKNDATRPRMTDPE